jgi:hypothetical protein
VSNLNILFPVTSVGVVKKFGVFHARLLKMTPHRRSIPSHHSTKVLVALQAMHPGTPQIRVAATKITPDMQAFGEYELF